MAEREGKYLVELFNKIGAQNAGKALSLKDIPLGEPFVYKHLGSMATVGRYKALVDLRQSKVGAFQPFIIKANVIYNQSICLNLLSMFLAGCKRHIACRILELVHLAFRLSDASRQLEEQVLCCSKLGYHDCLWQRQLKNRLISFVQHNTAICHIIYGYIC